MKLFFAYFCNTAILTKLLRTRLGIPFDTQLQKVMNDNWMDSGWSCFWSLLEFQMYWAQAFCNDIIHICLQHFFGVQTLFLYLQMRHIYLSSVFITMRENTKQKQELLICLSQDTNKTLNSQNIKNLSALWQTDKGGIWQKLFHSDQYLIWIRAK